MSIYYINPRGSMDQLSHLEVARLKQGAEGDLYPLYRTGLFSSIKLRCYH